MLKRTSMVAVVLSHLFFVADNGWAAKGESIQLLAGQSEYLRLEPILVRVHLPSRSPSFVPPGPGESKFGTLRFEINPPVKPRDGARPLPLEGQAPGIDAKTRDYDLLEWYQFPSEGDFTVRAKFHAKGNTLTSEPITLRIRNPASGDPESSPVGRIHHTPWCNYGTNKFCGDTFDLVNRWPDSRLAKYCHYWNGRFFQNNKQYNEAIASYQTVVKNYPDLALADDADFGIVECLYAQGKLALAQQYNTKLQLKYAERATASAGKFSGQTIVQRLSRDIEVRINRDLALK